MSAYTVTASAVLRLTGNASGGTAGEALAAGDVICQKADKKLYKAQNDGTLEEATIEGVCTNSAALGQPVSYAKNGAEIQVDTALFANAGILLLLSATAGKIGPAADLTTSSRVSVAGYTTGTNKFKLDIVNSGQQLPS